MRQKWMMNNKNIQYRQIDLILPGREMRLSGRYSPDRESGSANGRRWFWYQRTIIKPDTPPGRRGSFFYGYQHHYLQDYNHFSSLLPNNCIVISQNYY